MLRSGAARSSSAAAIYRRYVFLRLCLPAVLPQFDLPGIVWVDVVGLRDVPALERLGELR